LVLNYLGDLQYSIWVTASSITHWFGFLKIGLGTGLRNKFSEALVKKAYKQVKIYVSTAYASVTIIISVVYLTIFLVTK